MSKDVFSIEALSHEPADKRMDILRLIGSTRSISQAARQAGVGLPGDLQLVGFAEHPNRLRTGSKVRAILEENAVVLALV